MKVTIIVEGPDCTVEITEKPHTYATSVETLIELALSRVKAALRKTEESR